MKTRFAIGLCTTLAACDVPPPPSTGMGAHLDAGKDSTMLLDGSIAASCARGVVVVESDYQSTNVGLLALNGSVLTGSLASSATTSVGLTAPLSKDVSSPTARSDGDEIVVIDAAEGTGRVVWVDIANAKQHALPVETGFYADPQDYLRLSPTKAYVTRYRGNPSPGKQAFDAGSDVLIVDPSIPSITGSIALTSALGGASTLPRPDKMVRAGNRVFVLLSALGADYSATTSSRLAVIDPESDELTASLVLSGFRDCAGLALSPSGTELAVLCVGDVQSYAPSDLTYSGVVLVDITGAPKIEKSFHAESFGKNPVGFYGDYATEDALLLQTFGHWDATGATVVANDEILMLDSTTGTATALPFSEPPFTLGGVACSCGACFVADAQTNGGVVRRFSAENPSKTTPIKLETRPGLPPRYLGKF